MPSVHFFPTGKRGCKCSVEEIATWQLHNAQKHARWQHSLCSSSKHFSTLPPPRPHPAFHPHPPSSTGHHTKVLNAWIRLIRVAHIQADFYRLSGFPVFAWAKGGNAGLRSPEMCKNSSALRWSSSDCRGKNCHFSGFFLLIASLFQLPPLDWLWRAASDNDLSMTAHPAARQSSLTCGCGRMVLESTNFKLPSPEKELESKSRVLEPQRHTSTCICFWKYCLPFLY